jgi:hypothetical protein
VQAYCQHRCPDIPAVIGIVFVSDRGLPATPVIVIAVSAVAGVITTASAGYLTGAWLGGLAGTVSETPHPVKDGPGGVDVAAGVLDPAAARLYRLRRRGQGGIAPALQRLRPMPDRGVSRLECPVRLRAGGQAPRPCTV